MGSREGTSVMKLFFTVAFALWAAPALAVLSFWIFP